MPTVVDGSTVYYMDCDSNYAIASADIETGTKTLLCEDRADCYNVGYGYIYFQRNDPETPALCRMKTDGSDYEVLIEGNHMNLQTTAEYLYFRDYESEQTYRMPHNNPGNIELFHPGIVHEE